MNDIETERKNACLRIGFLDDIHLSGRPGRCGIIVSQRLAQSVMRFGILGRSCDDKC